MDSPNHKKPRGRVQTAGLAGAARCRPQGPQSLGLGAAVAAYVMSCFISRTACCMPTIRARATMLCPIFSSCNCAI